MNLFNSCIIGLSLNTDMLAHHLFKTLYLVDKSQNEIKQTVRMVDELSTNVSVALC